MKLYPFMKSNVLIFFIMLTARFPFALAQTGDNPGINSGTPTDAPASAAMSLWDILQSGGIIMVILGMISIIMFTLVTFLWMRLQVRRYVPEEFADKTIQLVADRKLDQARKQCQMSDSIIATIILSGIGKSAEGPKASAETSEMTARNEVSNIWSSLNYLNDIAQISPMLGLLGTVVGMIQAFNSIAFNTAVVKPILLAGGVSKAMITTAGGLTVGITAIIFYSLLRPRVQMITNALETHTTRLVEAWNK